MSPTFIRLTFPSRHWTDRTKRPVELAADLAERILAEPPKRLSVPFVMWGVREEALDPGDVGSARGDSLPGEKLCEWLTIYEGPGGRAAHLEIDLQAFGRWRAAQRTLPSSDAPPHTPNAPGGNAGPC